MKIIPLEKHLERCVMLAIGKAQGQEEELYVRLMLRSNMFLYFFRAITQVNLCKCCELIG